MLNRTITIDQLMSWEPCYSEEKILRLSQGKTEMTVEEILNLRFVPAGDKLWMLLREECVPARILHEFALWCAETALTKAEVTDERSWNTLKVKRLWLDGKATDGELNAAKYAASVAAWAARDAASAAACDAACDAARYAARAAACDAACDAARDAARAAAWAARDAASVAAWAARDAASVAAWAARDAARTAWDAAYDAARGEQLSKLREMLESASL